MKKIKNGIFKGERSFYMLKDAIIEDSVFDFGESPLKECENLILDHVTFKYKYPLWYSNHITVKNSTFEELSRSGIWYTNDMSIKDSTILAPKLFRRSSNITILNSDMPNAQEMAWNAINLTVINSHIVGDYFALNLNGGYFKNILLDGNYSFDGASNLYFEDCILNSKDSLWNTENVTMKNCKIIGEYIGWNSKNLHFINCNIESNQGFCYIKDLEIKDSVLENTDLAFEFCQNVSAKIDSDMISIKNPISGKIEVKKVGKIILDNELVDKNKVEINNE